MYEARKNKFYILERQKYNEERDRNYNEIIRPWSAREMFQYAEQRAYLNLGFSNCEGEDGKLVYMIDKTNIDIFQALSYYFTNDPKFETFGSERGFDWKLHKGLCLQGNVGRGKSLLMRLFSRNKRRCYNVVGCKEVAAEYAKKGGIELIEKYFSLIPDGSDPRTFYQKGLGMCFDDLGTEVVKKNFGNELNVMEEIILSRYDKKFEFPFDCTHITTNLSAEEIEQMYGTRVKSRFREMFNQVELGGEDRRI